MKKTYEKTINSLKNDGKFPISKDEKGRIIIDLDGDGIDDREENSSSPTEPENTSPPSNTPPPLN